MKDIMFFVGLACWLGWLIDTVCYVTKGRIILTAKAHKLIQFLAITLVTFSWYIV